MPDTTAPHGTLLFSAPITNPYGLGELGPDDVGTMASMAFVDIDADGDLDAYSGRYYQGKIVVFINSGTEDSPAFDAGVIDYHGLGLADSNGYTFSSPVLVDIDNDGDLDAFLGLGSDSIYFFHN